MTVRVYVPTTLPAVTAAPTAGEVPDHGQRIVAVDESEEAEYDALTQAAALSEELLRQLGTDAGRRRVVVVVESGDHAEDARHPWRDVVAVHIDTEDDADPDDDLGWYTPGEVEAGLGGL